MEFSLHGDFTLTGSTCAEIRDSWEGMWPALCEQVSHRVRKLKRLQSALKSTRRLFDRPCRKCDPVAQEKEKKEWIRKMGEKKETQPSGWAPDPLSMLKHHIRELMGGWTRESRDRFRGPVSERVYTPDQQGCAEMRTMDGGTLAVSPEMESSDYSLLRLGVAKTKGKSRVVTMQPARVKRILSPVHNDIYDYLSSYGWLVRGDFTKDDALTIINDRKPGEEFISGDYASATNELNQDAVTAVVDVLCESTALTDEERLVLRESFRRLRVRTSICLGSDQYEVNRGSMMGNLVSFPLLCLINKACFDIACDIVYGPLEGKSRKGRFNGDDCLFCGNDQFYEVWTEVTSTFGLVVNHAKTGKSSRWLELNSKTYDAISHRFVAKPVLSFLLRERDSKECLINQIYSGLLSFKSSVREYVVNCLMRFDISLRAIDIQTVPPKMLRSLVKRSWFRNALTRGPAPLVQLGTKRSVEMVIDRPPIPYFREAFSQASELVHQSYLRKWTGVQVRRYEEYFSRTNIGKWVEKRKEPTTHLHRLQFGPRVWRWIWPKVIRDYLTDRGLFDLYTLSEEECRDLDWFEDHPSLCVRTLNTWKVSPKTFCRPASLGVIRSRERQGGCKLREWCLPRPAGQTSWSP
uniref:RNA-dependent RNA polymerase n=1 Tax=Zhangzhou Botou tick virus 5 TaxID=2972052 RepID=A0A9E8A9G6_9VIRU|nr:MAG: RNA-dependent RNA polymerase [Zhangzhou Botou tick virus 5]